MVLKHRLRGWSFLTAVVVLALAGHAQAALQTDAAGGFLADFRLVATATSEARDPVEHYLDTAWRQAGGRNLYITNPVEPQETPVRRDTTPRMILQAPAPQANLADVGLGTASFDPEESGRAIPPKNLASLNMGPGSFCNVMSGRIAPGTTSWTQGNKTGISYIRPHVNIQMLMALEIPAASTEDTFEGPGFRPQALLAIDDQPKVDSRDIGSNTAQFGNRPRSAPSTEGQTGVTVGLDLGLLPTFLSQMGMGVSVVASRGQETGNLRMAIVGITELPVDWAPHERPIQHPTGMAVYPIVDMAAHEFAFTSGNISGSHPRDTGGTTPDLPPGEGDTGTSTGKLIPIIPITPVVPEPATLALLGSALAVMAARRLRSRSHA